MFTAHWVVNVPLVAVSVIVSVSVVPSYDRLTWKTSPLCRLMTDGSSWTRMSRALVGIVGESPSMNRPVELVPSLLLLKMSNLIAMLLGMPPARRRRLVRSPARRPWGPVPSRCSPG
jgi:hypothetical protein